jgi:hypothetical protein
MSRSAILAQLASMLLPDALGNILLPQSPPQFDNSLKLVTTAAMKAAGNQASGVYPYNVNTGIPASCMGGLVYAYGSSSLSFNLPGAGAAGFPIGAEITILNASSQPMTLSAVGTDKINFGASQVGSVIIPVNDVLTLAWNASSWFASSGGVMLQYSALFAASLVQASGYQKLPSGLIIEWGISQAITNGAGPTSVLYPLAFPHAPLVVLANYGNSSGAAGGNGNPCNAYPTASTSAFAIVNSGAALAQYNFIALGS